jgi:zinc and cadmium transporter
VVTVSATAGALTGVLCVSAVPLGVALLLPRDPAALRRAVRWLVGFAAGALLGAAFLHLVPESFALFRSPTLASALVLVGFFASLLLERYLWQHQHDIADEPTRHLPPLAALNLFGDAAHNLVDGMVIAGAFLSDPALGITTTVAVLLHEVPQEIGDYGVLLHAGLSRRRAIVWNLASAVVAVLGTVVVLAAGPRLASLSAGLLPFAAGNFIYIAASDLIPRLRDEAQPVRMRTLLLPMALGVVLTALPLLLGHD